jgi:hypothetical protein
LSRTDRSQGLICPNCSGVVPVPEGSRIVQCPFCQQHSLVQGERGVRRWQVRRQVERDQAQKLVADFFTGIDKARDLRRQANIKETFLVYLPYWRVQSFVSGWMFGRVKSGKDSTRPIEVEVMEEMHWNDAAVDTSEFGVDAVLISKEQLEPYDSDLLHTEAMVFEPSESRTEAMQEAVAHFEARGRAKRSMSSRYFDRFHLFQTQFSIVYYPLWVSRYEYRGRNYQVVVDGVKAQVAYGKAPGNILYRAGMLVGGLASGNFIMINGSALAAFLASGDDDGIGIACIPFIVGVALILGGYRAFRYGEEVETRPAEYRKQSMGAASGGLSKVFSKLSGSKRTGKTPLDLAAMGMMLAEEVSELQGTNQRRSR